MAMFVSEVEMERLNLARTADEVLARKLADVALKLGFADEITLQATGRISLRRLDHRRVARERRDVPVADEDGHDSRPPGYPDHMAAHRRRSVPRRSRTAGSTAGSMPGSSLR